MDFFKTHFYPITIPPLFSFLIAFMCGILWQSAFFELSHTIICVLLFFTTYILHKHITLSSVLWGIGYFCITLSGAVLYQQHMDDYCSFYTFAQNNKLVFTGTIEDINETIICNKSTKIITLNTHHITKNERVYTINKTVLLYIPFNNTLCVGDIVSFYNIECKKSNNEHLNFYQLREKIAATIFLNNPSYSIIYHPTWSFKRWVFEQKQKILRSCKDTLSASTFLFFSSLFLGNRLCVKSSMESVNEQFKQWGIYHFLSRSGLHLALFIVIWVAIFQYIPIPFFLKHLFIVFICAIYALFSWPSVPFIRSLVLFLFNRACLMTHSSYSLFHYLTLTCFCFLLYSPAYLFFIDFQLTFGITFALAWYNQLHGQYLYHEHSSQILNY